MVSLPGVARHGRGTGCRVPGVQASLEPSIKSAAKVPWPTRLRSGYAVPGERSEPYAPGTGRAQLGLLDRLHRFEGGDEHQLVVVVVGVGGGDQDHDQDDVVVLGEADVVDQPGILC